MNYFSLYRYKGTKLAYSHQMEDCPICLSNISNVKILACTHKFCTSCIVKWCRVNNTCPVCRSPQPPNAHTPVFNVREINENDIGDSSVMRRIIHMPYTRQYAEQISDVVVAGGQSPMNISNIHSYDIDSRVLTYVSNVSYENYRYNTNLDVLRYLNI